MIRIVTHCSRCGKKLAIPVIDYSDKPKEWISVECVSLSTSNIEIKSTTNERRREDERA